MRLRQWNSGQDQWATQAAEAMGISNRQLAGGAGIRFAASGKRPVQV